MASVYFEILKDWNFWEKEIDTGVPRKHYVEDLDKYTDFPLVTAISGIRRCGKSTILRQIIKNLHKKHNVPYENTLHINFEDPRFVSRKLDAVDLFDIFKEYQNNLKPKGKIYVFLDEVQIVTRWEQFVRTQYDLHDMKDDLKFFVTGSNTTVFASKLSTALTGRLMNYTVYPLSFKEFLDFKKGKNKINLLEEYLHFGGFPQVVLEKDESKKREFLISYYDVILENDVVLRHGVKNKDIVKDLAYYLLSNTGNLASSYALEKMLKVDSDDINRYLGYLEEAHIFDRVSMFAYSVRKQIYNPDKIYCVDSGFANAAGFNFSENYGRLLENAVYWQLKRQEGEIYYYKGVKEVDFVRRKGLDPEELINVTATVDDDEVLKRELGALEEAGKEYPQAQQILLTLYNQSGQKDPRIVSLLDFLLL